MKPTYFWMTALALIWTAPAAADDYCREFTQRILIDGQWVQGYGTSCLQPDGSWRLQSEEKYKKHKKHKKEDYHHHQQPTVIIAEPAHTHHYYPKSYHPSYGPYGYGTYYQSNRYSRYGNHYGRHHGRNHHRNSGISSGIYFQF